MKRQRMNVLTLSTIGLGALLTLSACSGDNTTDKPPANEAADVAVVDDAPSAAADSEAVASDTASDIASDSDTMAADAHSDAAVASTDVSGTEAAIQETTSEPQVLAANAGATLYEIKCKACHEVGLLNAPKYGDVAAWSPRLAKDKETLYMHSAHGFNKMPAQAVNGVTEAQIKAAVDYMIEAVS